MIFIIMYCEAAVAQCRRILLGVPRQPNSNLAIVTIVFF